MGNIGGVTHVGGEHQFAVKTNVVHLEQRVWFAVDNDEPGHVVMFVNDGTNTAIVKIDPEKWKTINFYAATNFRAAHHLYERKKATIVRDIVPTKSGVRRLAELLKPFPSWRWNLKAHDVEPKAIAAGLEKPYTLELFDTPDAFAPACRIVADSPEEAIEIAIDWFAHRDDPGFRLPPNVTYAPRGGKLFDENDNLQPIVPSIKVESLAYPFEIEDNVDDTISDEKMTCFALYDRGGKQYAQLRRSRNDASSYLRNLDCTETPGEWDMFSAVGVCDLDGKNFEAFR